MSLHSNKQLFFLSQISWTKISTSICVHLTVHYLECPMQAKSFVSQSLPNMYFIVCSGAISICFFGLHNVCQLEMANLKQFLLLFSVWFTLVVLFTCISYNSWFYSTYYLTANQTGSVWSVCQITVTVLFVTSQMELLVLGFGLSVLYNHIYEAYFRQQEVLQLRAFLYPSMVFLTAFMIANCGDYLMNGPETSFCFKYLSKSPFLTSARAPFGWAVVFGGMMVFLARMIVWLVSGGFVPSEVLLDAINTLYLLSHLVGVTVGCMVELGSVQISPRDLVRLEVSFQWAELVLVGATMLVLVAVLASVRPLRGALL